DRDLGPQVLDEDLARQTVHAVDQHRAGAADAVGALAAVSQAAALLPLDVVEDVEHALVGVDVELVPLPARAPVVLRVEALDPYGDLHVAPNRPAAWARDGPA